MNYRCLFKSKHMYFYYLQGVIRDEKDLDRLGSDFKQAYSKRQIDPFDDEGWDR